MILRILTVKIAAVMCLVIFSLNCSNTKNGTDPQPANVQKNTNTSVPAKPNEDGTIPSGTGTEKGTPAPGKGNVQGKAFFNDKPAVGVEVKLCKTFSQFMGGCGGETFTAKTDDAGEYLIKEVPPGTYEGLTIKVFDTPYYVFATSGFVSAAKYPIEGDKTYFAPDSHLFKNDVKLANPRAGAKVAPENLEVKWEPYPDAAYYKLSIHADSSTGAETVYDYINKRVDGVSFVLDIPLKPGTYTCKVEAYNANERRLARTSDDIKFTVK